MLKRIVLGVLLSGVLGVVGVCGQAPASAKGTDPFAALSFLEGSWKAHGTGQGVVSDGVYAFHRELGGHVLARHAGDASCKAPESFDCEHRDLLYVYADMPGQPLKAIYFDSEGHVIHYDVTTPEPASVEFLSEAHGGMPRFRLRYALKDGVMLGSFAMQPPGQTTWRPYLEWSGGKQ
jgi:hypothetical protein